MLKNDMNERRLVLFSAGLNQLYSMCCSEMKGRDIFRYRRDEIIRSTELLNVD